MSNLTGLGELNMKDNRKKARYDTVKLDKIKTENKGGNQIIFLIYLFVFVFLSLFVYLAWIQINDGEQLRADYRNPSLIQKEKNVVLGNIYDKDMNILATTEVVDGKNIRKYPEGETFAHIVGYSAISRAGLESSLYKTLLETPYDNESVIEKIKSISDIDKKNKGNSVITTIDSELQKLCYDSIGDRKGAIVLMEPKTGKILSMVSKPSFDPNNLEENWNNLISDEENSPLLNRATSGLYPPGSTFKVLTAIEYMRENKDYNTFSYTCPGVIERYSLPVACAFNNAHGTVDLARALELSCNGAFIDMGLTLDIDKYRDTVESFGFNNELPVDNIGYEVSRFSLNGNSDVGEIMQTVFGQGNTLVTPLQNCFVAATIANDGVMMRAQIVDRVVDINNNIVKEIKPKEYRTVLKQSENETIKTMMQGVVTNGIAGTLNTSKYTVACKTGTAQYNNNKNTHNLIIGFAPVEDPKIAFSIVLEGYKGQPEIDRQAINTIKKILDKYLGE